MALGKDFVAFVEERLSGLGVIRVKKMFGGAGVYCDGLFFALLDDDELYLKADDETRGAFEAARLRQFTFTPKDGPTMAMSYYRAPESVFDDEDELRQWTGLALEAARRAARKKPAKAIAKGKQKSRS